MKKFLIATALLFPFQILAQTTARTIIVRSTESINMLIKLMFGLATVVFFWGVIQFIVHTSGGDHWKAQKSKSIMTWGIIGLAVMAAAWGVTNVLVEYFDIPAGEPRGLVPPIFKNPFP